MKTILMIVLYAHTGSGVSFGTITQEFDSYSSCQAALREFKERAEKDLQDLDNISLVCVSK